VFSFPLIQGEAQKVLEQPYSALVTQSFADHYFNGNAMGKILETFDGEDREKFTITGILKDIPGNSHFKFDVATRGSSRTKNFLNRDAGFWDWGGLVYVVMDDKSDATSLEQKLSKLAIEKNDLKRNKDDYGQVSTFELQPLRDIHLNSHLLYELEPNGSSILVYAMILLAGIVVVIAWINYVNLSTAISEQRSKSIGIRKVIGATRPGLIYQVLTESALLNGISMMVAVLLVGLSLEQFSSFAGIPLDYSMLYNKWTLYAMTCFVVMSSIMSGIYPSWFISSFSSVQVLKGKLHVGGSFALRKVLVVFQFAAAVILMIAAIVSVSQLTFMRSKELGITIDKVVVLKAMNFDKETWSNAAGGFVVDSAYANKVEVFKEELRKKASIANVTSLSHLPGEVPSWGNGVQSSFNRQ
jgi:putative ABC transport system permease protein